MLKNENLWTDDRNACCCDEKKPTELSGSVIDNEVKLLNPLCRTYDLLVQIGIRVGAISPNHKPENAECYANSCHRGIRDVQNTNQNLACELEALSQCILEII